MKHRRHILGAALFAAAAVMLAAVPAQAKTYYAKTTKNYSWSTADKKWKLSDQHTYSYTKKGMISKDIYKSGDYKSVSTYKYNSRGQQTSSITKVNGKVTSKYTNKYDKKGNILEATDYYNGTIMSKSIHSYSKGRVKTIKYYNYDNGKKILASSSHYSYNKKGYISKVVHKGADGKTLSTAKYTYKFKGGRISQETIKYTGDMNSTHVTKYYSNGIIKSESYKNKNYKYSNSYNKKGMLTKSTDSGSNSKATTTYTYKNDLLVKRVHESKDESGTHKFTYTYKYKIGKKGVTTQTIYSNGEKMSKTEYTY